jgi:uncharacterized protein (TIGR03000 family)
MSRLFAVLGFFTVCLTVVATVSAQQPSGANPWENYWPRLWTKYGAPMGLGYSEAPNYGAPPLTASAEGSRAFYYQPDRPSPVRVNVRVPAFDAKVWFDGSATQQQGINRSYESPALAAGRTYSYQVRAQWMENGQVRETTRTVNVRAGENVVVDFTRS